MQARAGRDRLRKAGTTDFLRRLTGGDKAPVSQWSRFPDDAARDAFLLAVDTDLRRRGLEPQIADGYADVSAPDGEHDFRLGLDNLAQNCAMSEQHEWAAMIAKHFDVLFDAQVRGSRGSDPTFDEVRPRLRVRILPDDGTEGGYPPSWAMRRPAPGLLAMLAIDYPDHVSILSPSKVDAWPVTADEAYRIALADTAALPTPRPQVLENDRSRSLMFSDASVYVASMVLFRESILSPGTKDALVGVPNRHMLFVHEMVDASAMFAIQALAEITQDGYREGPGSISNSLYWWRGGDLVLIPGWMEGDSFHLQPPDEFVELLDRLA